FSDFSSSQCPIRAIVERGGRQTESMLLNSGDSSQWNGERLSCTIAITVHNERASSILAHDSCFFGLDDALGDGKDLLMTGIGRDNQSSSMRRRLCKAGRRIDIPRPILTTPKSQIDQIGMMSELLQTNLDARQRLLRKRVLPTANAL